MEYILPKSKKLNKYCSKQQQNFIWFVTARLTENNCKGYAALKQVNFLSLKILTLLIDGSCQNMKRSILTPWNEEKCLTIWTLNEEKSNLFVVSKPKTGVAGVYV